MKKGSPFFVGFDGFIDTLLHCVKKRLSPKKFTRVAKIADFATTVKKAASKNANVECVPLLQDLGGNGPILARALASLGNEVILAGCCGFPDIHPSFAQLQQKNLSLHSIANPGLTDALEFSDGKLFLGKMGELDHVTLTTVLKRYPGLPKDLMQARCIATTNWTMMPFVEEFWRYLLQNRTLLQHSPTLFVDLADPAKRSASDLTKALRLLKKLNTVTPVILGLNQSESEQVAACVSVTPEIIPLQFLKTLKGKLGLTTVLLHTKTYAAVASDEGTEWTSIPFISHPVRTTGAGDTFNAGFLSAFVRGGSIADALNHAVAASGIFVRTGIPPTLRSIKDF